MIVVVHGGQTGVDRGGHHGALANGWQVRGFAPADGCDEDGPIPDDVIAFLERHRVTGLSARTHENLRWCDLLLVMVEDKQKPWATPGTKTTLTMARNRKPYLERMVVDPSDGTAHIAKWILDYKIGNVHRLPRLAKHVWLMVAGPRRSKWVTGEVAMRDYLITLKQTLEVLDGSRAL